MQQNQLSGATGILWTSQPFSGLAYLIKGKYFTKVFVSYFVNGNPYPIYKNALWCNLHHKAFHIIHITRYCDIHSIVIPNAQSSAMCKGHSWMLKNKSTHKIFPFIDSMHLSFFFICLIVNNQFYVFFIFFIRIFNNTHSI